MPRRRYETSPHTVIRVSRMHAFPPQRPGFFETQLAVVDILRSPFLPAYVICCLHFISRIQTGEGGFARGISILSSQSRTSSMARSGVDVPAVTPTTWM